MKYAVVKIQGKQHLVEEGETILVEKVSKEINPQILLIVDGDNIKIGSPQVKDGKVQVKKLEDTKGEKIYVQKYKAKSRYRKRIGFRSQKTKLLIEKIS